MHPIRDMGIYKLPDGRRYVAVRMPFGGHALHLEAKVLPAEPAYRVNHRGRVLDAVSLQPVFPPGPLEDTGETYTGSCKKLR